jgi:signal transduction histidine kinase
LKGQDLSLKSEPNLDPNLDLNLEPSSDSNFNIQNRVKAILVREHFERSLPSSLGSIFVLTFMGIIYQFGTTVLAGPMFVLGVGIAIATTFRGVISYLGVKNKISIYANEKYVKVAVILNSSFWGMGFCLDAWYSKIDGIERLVALALIMGFTSVAPVALITIPIIQAYFFICCLLFPALIYLYRVFDGHLPTQAIAIPGFLLILFFYQLSTSRKLSKMLIRDIENSLKLKIEQENLKATLDKLRETQGELSVERAKALNSERLAFLGSMASGVAHEINNPLTISGGQVFKIQNYLTKHPEADSSGLINACIEKISEMNARIRNIVRGLQHFSRSRAVEDPEVFSIGELVEFTAIFFNEKMKSQEIHFEMDPPPEISINGQKSELSQALFNIIDNAIEATYGVPERKINVKYQVLGQQVQILIIDNGKGVNEAIKEQIFDPFFTTKDVGQGTGLGLSVARGIIKAHGGDIQFTSNPGATTFSVSLPIALTV